MLTRYLGIPMFHTYVPVLPEGEGDLSPREGQPHVIPGGDQINGRHTRNKDDITIVYVEVSDPVNPSCNTPCVSTNNQLRYYTYGIYRCTSILYPYTQSTWWPVIHPVGMVVVFNGNPITRSYVFDLPSIYHPLTKILPHLKSYTHDPQTYTYSLTDKMNTNNRVNQKLVNN